MNILAFLMTVIYVPGFLGVSIQPGWALMSCTLPLVAWKGPAVLPGPLQVLGVAFIGYALLSLYWTPNINYAVGALWQLSCVIFAFIYGSKLKETDRLVKGLAIGLSASSAVSITQALDYHTVLEYIPGRYAGLFFNPVIASEATALVIIWLASKRLWFFIPALLPALYLAHSRSGYLILVFVGLLWLSRLTWLANLGIICLVGVAITSALGTGTEDAWRIALWQLTIQHLSPLGAGAGAMDSIYLSTPIGLVSPENAHNEFLDLAFQYGIVSLLVWAILLPAIRRFNIAEWHVLAGWLGAATFSFPLHVPVLAFIGATCAGHLYRHRPVAWRDFCYSGYGFLHRLNQWRLQSGGAWSAPVPVQSNLGYA